MKTTTPHLKLLLLFLMAAFVVSATAYVALKMTVTDPTDDAREALTFCYTIANGTLGALLGAVGGAKASA